MRGPEHCWVSEMTPRVYRLTLPAAPSDEELERYIEARIAFAESCAHRHAWVVDARELGRVSAKQRRRFAEHLELVEDCDARWNVGSAIVLTSAIARGVVTAVVWLRSPRFPHRTFDSLELAEAWCREQLG